MKKLGLFVLTVIVLSLTFSAAFAETYDVSVFENNPAFEVEFDEMDDTGEISLTEDCVIMGTSDGDTGDFLLGTVDIKIIPDMPPVIRLNMSTMSDKRIKINKFIVKPADTRYTFEVKSDWDYEDGHYFETFTIAITDQSISMLEDILNGNSLSIKYRLAGDRNVDGSFFLTNDRLKTLYDAYVASGALNNDFSILRSIFPCTIK